MPCKIKCLAVFSLVLVVAALIAPPPVSAAILTVTDLGDTGAPGQLRTFINLASSGDTIVIPPGTITLTGVPEEDANGSGDLDIHKDLTIQGAGAGVTIIDGGRIDRVLDISCGCTVIISGLTLRNGNVSGFGGGVFNRLANLTLTNVNISSNVSGSSAGGIGNVGTANLTNVSISGNRTTINGGGIFNEGTMRLINSTISSNVSGSAGGGIANVGTATLTNATISGNLAGSVASGGIANLGAATLTNVLLSGNMALFGGNCIGTMTSLGHNLDSGTTCGFAGPGDLSNTDPKLGPLQNNGGFTLTHALLPGSPAIDAGDNAGCPSTDQRGIIRPQGTACDIGAYEFVAGSVAQIPAVNQWGMIGLGMGLAAAFAWRLRCRSPRA